MKYYLLIVLGSILLMGAKGKDKKIKKTPDQINAQAIRFTEAEQYDSAIIVFNELIKIDPNYADAYYNRGGCKQQVGNHRGAISDFDHAIHLKPKDPDSYYNRGLSKFDVKSFRGAMADFSKVIELAPHYAEAYADRAFCEKELGMVEKACIDFHQAYDKGAKYTKKEFSSVCEQ